LALVARPFEVDHSDRRGWTLEVLSKVPRGVSIQMNADAQEQKPLSEEMQEDYEAGFWDDKYHWSGRVKALEAELASVKKENAALRDGIIQVADKYIEQLVRHLFSTHKCDHFAINIVKERFHAAALREKLEGTT